MAKPTKKELEKEVARLKSQVTTLQSNPRKNTGNHKFGIKLFSKWLAFALACAVLVVANISFYTARTVVETDKFMAVASPLIRQPAVQDAIADKTTRALLENVDIQKTVNDLLPDRAGLLAPVISSQVENFTRSSSKQILASEKFQSIYDNSLETSHRTFIKAIRSYEGDGTINIQEIYNRLSQQLQDTKLSFLAGKQLPSKVGQIQVIKADWLPAAHNLVVNLTAIRIATIGFFAALVGIFIWLSVNRRRALIQLGVGVFLVGLATVLALNVAGTIITDNAKNYPEAAQRIWQVFTGPLKTQTYGGMLVGGALAIVAWLGSSTARASSVRAQASNIFSGRFHESLFPKENNLTLWFGKHRTALQTTVAVLFLLTCAFISISWASILLAIGLAIVLSLGIELVASKK